MTEITPDVHEVLREAAEALDTAAERYDCAGLTDLEEFREIEAARGALSLVLSRTRERAEAERRADLIRGWLTSHLQARVEALLQDTALLRELEQVLVEVGASLPSRDVLDGEIRSCVFKLRDEVDDLGNGPS